MLVLRAVLRHPLVATVAIICAVAYLAVGAVRLGAAWGVAAVVLVARYRFGRDSFDRAVGWRARGHLRGWWIYGRRWTSPMTMSGLGDRYLGADYVPKLRRVRSNGHVDRLTVQLLQGQHPDDFANQADTLAHTFGMLACRSRIAMNARWKRASGGPATRAASGTTVLARAVEAVGAEGLEPPTSAL